MRSGVEKIKEQIFSPIVLLNHNWKGEWQYGVDFYCSAFEDNNKYE